MSKHIVVEVGTDGSVKIEGRGFTGTECERATAALRQALGTEVENRRTADFYATEPNKIHQGR